MTSSYDNTPAVPAVTAIPTTVIVVRDVCSIILFFLSISILSFSFQCKINYLLISFLIYMTYYESTALPLVLIFEGSFSADPADRGGRTNRGITQTIYDNYRLNKDLPVADVKDISDKEVADIYLNSYWLPSKCDQMSDKLGLVVFDSSVNNGQSRSIKFLQQSMGIKTDGIIGPETISKLVRVDQDQLANTFLSNRINFFHAIVSGDPTQAIFLKGWLRRMNFLRDFIGGIKTLDQISSMW